MKVPSHRSSSLLPSLTTSLSLALLVVVISTFVVLASSTADGDDDDGDLICDSSNPHWHPLDETLWLYTFDSLSSTQDEAKRIAESGDWNAGHKDSADAAPPRSFVVTTREQTSGRGTNNRVWMGQRGNVFVTIGIRQEDWINSRVPLTLLPLKIGSLVARHVQGLLNECYDDKSGRHDVPLVTVKWPNDVLVDERKISGVLIESSSNGWFLIGIGINLAYAPEVAQSGPNRGRPATSIGDLCPTFPSVGERKAQQLGIDLAYNLHSFVHPTNELLASSRNGDSVLNEWKQWIDWDMELVMRDTPDQERVRLIDVLPDGRVQVQNLLDGRIRTLVSDYFL